MTLKQMRLRETNCYRPNIAAESIRKLLKNAEIWNRLQENDWAGFLECWVRYVPQPNEQWQEQLIWMPPDVSPSEFGLGPSESVGETIRS